MSTSEDFVFTTEQRHDWRISRLVATSIVIPVLVLSCLLYSHCQTSRDCERSCGGVGKVASWGQNENAYSVTCTCRP